MKTNITGIEYSHIYTNENFSREHRRSIRRMKKVIGGMENTVFAKTVLIDDYNSTEQILDIPEFLRKLEKLDAGVDYYALEADMSQYQDMMMGSIIGSKILRSYERYVGGKNHLPCSFMTAI